MNPAVDEFLSAWPFEPWPLLGALVCSLVYLRGWRSLHRGNPARWGRRPLAAFLAGQGCLLLALSSPLEVHAARLLQVHMVQHLLLTMAAPPLLWLGKPLVPLLRGLPRSVVALWIAPLFRSSRVRRLFAALTHPLGAWLVFTTAVWGWHVPALYELALASEGWHHLQHACFLGTALLFWYPVVRPFPARPRWSPWLLLPCLLLADVQNTALSAVLTFAERPLYPSYTQQPRPWGISSLDDQATAGALMWVPGSLAFLVPLCSIGLGLLSGRGENRTVTLPNTSGSPSAKPPRRLALPLIAPAPPLRPDLLRVPLLGRFLSWRYARLALQLPLLLLAMLVIWDGLAGPETGPMNLAGVLPWIHWRGLVILTLLTLGNFFCLACPFLVPRWIARTFLPARWSWPPVLRGKWPALVLLLAFLWAYEALALWDSPWWTAWIALGYLVAATVVDGLFRGAAFCKHVCPIGQFNFIQSLLAPFSVQVRDPAVCSSCRTHDCLRGRDGIPGCELGLNLPRKAGNLDCTACLDCVHACPHDNIGILAVPPGEELSRDTRHPGTGRPEQRLDLAALVVVLVFGAFANAAGMVGPVVEWQQRWTEQVGLRSPLLAVSLFYLGALLVAPLLLVGTAAVLARHWGRLSGTAAAVATRGAYALVPIGAAMWLTHYSFHLLTSWDACIPAAQRLASDLGWTLLGEPEWSCCCCVVVPAWLHDLESVVLFAGLLGSLHVARRIAVAQTETPRLAWRAFLPWAALVLLLFVVGVWITLQPMQMRGTMQMLGG